MFKERFDIEKPMVSYVRDKNGARKGVLLSGIWKDKVCFGWSLCKTTDKIGIGWDIDKFDRDFGVFEIAQGRAMKNERMSVDEDGFACTKLPESIYDDVRSFVGRIKRYYKNTKKTAFLNGICRDFTYEEV